MKKTTKKIKFNEPMFNMLTFDYNVDIHIHTVLNIDYDTMKRSYYILLRDMIKFITDVCKEKSVEESDIRDSIVLKDKTYTIKYVAAGLNTSQEVEIIDMYTAVDLIYTFLDSSMTKQKLWFLKTVYNTLFIVSENGGLVYDILSGKRISGTFPEVHNKPDKLYTTTEWKTEIFEKLKGITNWLSEKYDMQKQLKDAIRYCIVILNEHGYDPNAYRDEYIKQNPRNSVPFALDIIEYYDDMRNEFTVIVDNIIEQNDILF